MSKSIDVLIDAYNKGYRVKDGVVFSPYRNKPIKLQVNTNGYYRFSIVHKKQREHVLVHRLVAYQKYGWRLFKSGIEIRHLDNNYLNNLEDNIVFGTHSENMMDKPEKVRKSASIEASTNIRKFTDAEMDAIRRYHGGSYKDTMAVFDITSKGTLHYILSTEYQTSV